MSLIGRTLNTSILLGVFLCASHVQFSIADEKVCQECSETKLVVCRLCPETELDNERIQKLLLYRDLALKQDLPALRDAQQYSPNDIELNSTLIDVLLNSQNTANTIMDKAVIDEATKIAQHLKTLDGGQDLALFALARIQILKGERTLAKEQMLYLVKNACPELATRVADVLIEELYKDKQYDLAYGVAQTALCRDPESRYSTRFSLILPEVTASSGFSVDLAYRFEYDDNVAYPDEDFATGEEDYRHVLIADILYDRPIGVGWNFYAQGHFLQSLYHQFDQFNQTRVSASAAIGKDGEKIGWRFPIEINKDWLDGESYRTSLLTRPGLFLQFGKTYFGHFYGRIQRDDYDNYTISEEDRSGDVFGGGVLIAGQVNARFQLHSYLEYNRYDTDGNYWQRDELVAFVYGEVEFSPRWMAGLALRYQKDDYDNVRPVFAARQQDQSKEVYLNLTHKFNSKWRARGQVSIIDHDSNIAIFDYTRNVYSFSIIREF